MLPLLYLFGVVAIVAGVALGVRHLKLDARVRRTDTLPAVAALIAVGLTLLAIAVQVQLQPDGEIDAVLKAGVVSGGVVTVIFGIWLNHRRYRVEEARQQVEREKADLDRKRHDLEQDKAKLEYVKDQREHAKAADETVLRAVEMLGHTEPSVRAGALHSLAGLAKSRPDRAQEVAELICMYLRTAPGGEKDPAMREAQKILHQVVLAANKAAEPVHDLEIDLTGAHLDELMLGHVTVRALNLAGARLTGRTSLHKLRTTPGEFSKDIAHSVGMDGATFDGPVLLHAAELKLLSAKGATFTGGLSLAGTTIDDELLLSDTTVAGHAEFTDAIIGKLNCDIANFKGQASFRRMVLRGGATFVQARFGQADFDQVRWQQRVVLDEAHFHDSLSFLPQGNLDQVSLRRTTVGAHIAAGRLRLPPGWCTVSAERDEVRYLNRT